MLKQGRAMRVILSLVMISCTLVGRVAYAEDHESVKNLVDKYHQAGDNKKRNEIVGKIRDTEPKTQGDIELLMKTAEREDIDFQNAALASLRQIKDPEFAKIFHKHSKKGEVKTRVFSIYMLGELKYKESVPDLIEMVELYDKQTKQNKPADAMLGLQAAMTLAEIGDERAIPVLISKLGKMDYMEAQIIAQFGAKALPQLIEFLKISKDEDANREAYNAIGLMKDKNAIPALWDLAKADIKYSSSTYIHSLLNVTDKTTTPTYDEVVGFVYQHAEENLSLKGEAIEIAKKKADIEYLNSIVKNKKNYPPFRKITIGYLGELKAESAIPTLVEALKDDNREIRQCAAKALENITGKRYEWSPK